MEKERSHVSGFSAIGVTAALSVLIFLGVTGWQTYQAFVANEKSYVAIDVKKGDASSASPDLPGATSNVGSSAIGAAVLEELVARYVTLQKKGIYTPEMGQREAEEMASTLLPDVPFTHYSASDIATDPITTKERALIYRRDLQESLKPLLENKQAEFEIFAYYIDTKDTKYLMQLKAAAQNYRAAARATVRVVVPKDAVAEHIAILNAMEEFAATLDAQVANVSDPLASLALLRTYNQAEAKMLTSFNALTTYYKEKNS